MLEVWLGVILIEGLLALALVCRTALLPFGALMVTHVLAALTGHASVAQRYFTLLGLIVTAQASAILQGTRFQRTHVFRLSYVALLTVLGAFLALALALLGAPAYLVAVAMAAIWVYANVQLFGDDNARLFGYRSASVALFVLLLVSQAPAAHDETLLFLMVYGVVSTTAAHYAFQ